MVFGHASFVCCQLPSFVCANLPVLSVVTITSELQADDAQRVFLAIVLQEKAQKPRTTASHRFQIPFPVLKFLRNFYVPTYTTSLYVQKIRRRSMVKFFQLQFHRGRQTSICVNNICICW